MCLCFPVKLSERNSLDEMFAAPATTLEWKTSKTGTYSIVLALPLRLIGFLLSLISWRGFYYCTYFFSPPTLEWLRNEKSTVGPKVCRRQVCMSPTHREVPKTNGHSVILPPSVNSIQHSTPRLGRPLNLRPHSSTRYSLHLLFLPFIFSFLSQFSNQLIHDI